MDKALGRRLRSLRRRAGLSATALAGAALSVATISRIEHGAIAPSLATLRYLAGRLGCSVADLLTPDDAEQTRQAGLDAAEAWLLLEQPAQALTVLMALERQAAGGDGDGAADPPPSAQAVALGRRLEWARARAAALLDPAAAPALAEALIAAQRAGDHWVVARLVAVRSAALEEAEAIRLLSVALAALPEVGPTPDEQALRARLCLLLARLEERRGAVETARGLYVQAAHGSERCRQPALVSRSLLAAGDSLAAAAPLAATSRRPAPSAALVLAALAAGQEVWLAATLSLARLELQAGRLEAAARRLRQAPIGTDAAMLLSADLVAELRRLGSRLRPSDWGSAAAEDPSLIAALARIEGALQSGDLEEGERQGALLATAVAGAAPDLAHDLWLRLALAWAEAGNALRAAQALRLARGQGNRAPDQRPSNARP